MPTHRRIHGQHCDYSPDELEFMKACEKAQREKAMRSTHPENSKTLTCAEILEIVHRLGYVRDRS